MRKPKDWGQPCPNPECSHYRLMNRGNISTISTYMTQSEKRRIFYCNKCDHCFAEIRDTVFFDLRTPEDKVMMWLDRAAQKAHEINTHLLRDLPVTEV
nr:hypothetical protein [Desulfobacter sp.]